MAYRAIPQKSYGHVLPAQWLLSEFGHVHLNAYHYNVSSDICEGVYTYVFNLL